MFVKKVFARRINSLVKTVLANNLKNVTHYQVRHATAFKFVPETAPSNLGETTKMNLCQSITNALDLTLSTDKTAGQAIEFIAYFFHLNSNMNLNFK